MTRVALRWHIFEANVNWFTLILQVHGAKPLDEPSSRRRFDWDNPAVLTQ